jgi:hypothetical protein
VVLVAVAGDLLDRAEVEHLQRIRPVRRLLRHRLDRQHGVDQRGALAAVLLGDRDAREPLAGNELDRLAREPVDGGGEAVELAGGEATDGFDEVALLVAQTEVHQRLSWSCWRWLPSWADALSARIAMSGIG